MSKLSIMFMLFTVVLLIAACQPLQAPEPMTAITGDFFSTPVDQGTTPREYFGNIDVKVLDPLSHEAEGTIAYNIYDGDMETWDGVQATAEYAVFDELQQRAVIVARIDETIGSVDGAPGDYACFWVKNDAVGDQIGLHYYTHAFSAEPGEITSKVFWPADSDFASMVDTMAEADPSLIVDVAYGDLAFLAGS